MPEPSSPPPDPPSLDLTTVRRLADHFEDMARHMYYIDRMHVLDRDLTPDSNLLAAVQANLTAALVLREAYDVDLDR